jgi:hypothetical protein
MRRVDWPIVIGPALPFTFDRRPSGVVSVLAAADELASYRDVDTIARRAVELARDRLGLERVALFLLGDDDQFYGTFGTGARGETTDERDIVFAVGDSHREAISQSLAGVSRWTVLKDVPLLTQVDGRTLVIGRGWNAITPARSGGAAVGLFVNDAALGLAPLDESKQVQLPSWPPSWPTSSSSNAATPTPSPGPPPSRGPRTLARASRPRRCRRGSHRPSSESAPTPASRPSSSRGAPA